MSDVEAPASGPLSVDQAVSLLGERAPVEAAPTPEAPQSEAPPEAEAPATEPETANEGEQPETPEPETPAIEPPKFWDADAKAKFAELAPEHQAVVLAQVEKGVQASAKAIQEASTRAKQAEEQSKGVKALADELSTFLPQFFEAFKSDEESFKTRWSGVNWADLSSDQWMAYRPAFEAERDALTDKKGKLEQLTAVNQQAQLEARSAFVREQTQALATVAPDLADPKEGPARRQAVGAWLKEQGASDDDLNGLTALQAGIAYDAMRYRQAKAAAIPKPIPKPAPVKVVPPSTSAANPQHRSVMDASARLNKSGSMDDAIALLAARRKG